MHIEETSPFPILAGRSSTIGKLGLYHDTISFVMYEKLIRVVENSQAGPDATSRTFNDG